MISSFEREREREEIENQSVEEDFYIKLIWIEHHTTLVFVCACVFDVSGQIE